MGSDGLLMMSPINANAPPDDERKRWRPFCAGLSHNQPSVEPALAELLRKHPSLVSVELVEHSDRHLPTRAKDEIGRALLENKSRKLSFLHCDMCVRTFMTNLPPSSHADCLS